MSTKWSARKIAFLAMGIALALVIEVLASLYFRMPQGGSISLVMVPIVIIGYFYGCGTAIVCAIAVGVLQGIFVPPSYVNFFQYFLDYILAFGVLGFGTAFIGKGDDKHKMVLHLEFGIVLCYIVKYFCHVISGTLFFAEYAGDQIVIVYSLVYNISYVAPALVAALLVTPPVLLAVQRYKKNAAN